MHFIAFWLLFLPLSLFTTLVSDESGDRNSGTPSIFPSNSI